MTTFSSTSYWSDRKRILTMPIGNTAYNLTDVYLSITDGLLRQQNYNILLYNIHSVGCRQGIRQRCVNQGDIIIYWKDGTQKTCVIQNIKDPLQVKEMILALSENAKRSRFYRSGRYQLPPFYMDRGSGGSNRDLNDADDWY